MHIYIEKYIKRCQIGGELSFFRFAFCYRSPEPPCRLQVPLEKLFTCRECSENFACVYALTYRDICS